MWKKWHYAAFKIGLKISAVSNFSASEIPLWKTDSMLWTAQAMEKIQGGKVRHFG